MCWVTTVRMIAHKMPDNEGLELATFIRDELREVSLSG